MLAPELTIDREAIKANWRALDALCACETGAVVKANGYGLGAPEIGQALSDAGARKFFVATYGEAMELAQAFPQFEIFEFSGLSSFVVDRPQNIIPVCTSKSQLDANGARDFVLQFDTGMTRLGFPADAAPALAHLKPKMVLSHLASADEPESPQNQAQLGAFRAICAQFPAIPASLAATGGILLGRDYHFDLTRPGIGIYGGAPFLEAKPTIRVELPVLASYDIEPGTAIGYNARFVAEGPMRVATVLGGYADGISRALSMGKASLFAGDIPCPVLGRISMDAITVDISALEETPRWLSLITPAQSINDLAHAAATISYELFTSLGSRYKRVYV